MSQTNGSMGHADAAGPAYRIETSRLVIRCWQPGDAPLLKEAADSSTSHLRPWMPWATIEPASFGGIHA